MPLVDVTYDLTVTDTDLRRLARVLPELVAEAVACPEEPWAGPLKAGDIDIRFTQRSALDVGGLRCVIEVRTKLFASRVQNKQERADLIRARLVEELGTGLGVWLILADGAWSQAD